jgi:hypothetical protein
MASGASCFGRPRYHSLFLARVAAEQKNFTSTPLTARRAQAAYRPPRAARPGSAVTAPRNYGDFLADMVVGFRSLTPNSCCVQAGFDKVADQLKMGRFEQSRDAST